MSRYVLYVNGEASEHRTTGKSPARALRELAEMAGLELREQDGRYGRLTDGRSVRGGERTTPTLGQRGFERRVAGALKKRRARFCRARHVS
jgi:hypothetical protein